MTFPGLESIGFGPASHRVVLRLLAFLYSDSRKVNPTSAVGTSFDEFCPAFVG